MNFNEVNTAELDKDLTREEQAEWNSIYASYRSGSLLSGTVSGIDGYRIGDSTRTLAAVIIPYRVKILIPELYLWENCEKVPERITRNLLGAKIDFVVQKIDRENGFCVASRIAAAKIKRKRQPKKGDYITCNVLAVGKSKLLAEACGFDVSLTQRDLCYSIAPDLRFKFTNGQPLTAVVKETDGDFSISVRDASPHPYDGVKLRHPINSRRVSIIVGKYKGAVFCKLENDFDCLCKYSEYQNDADFDVGDKVVIAVKKHYDSNKRVYGVIISKWKEGK